MDKYLEIFDNFQYFSISPAPLSMLITQDKVIMVTWSIFIEGEKKIKIWKVKKVKILTVIAGITLLNGKNTSR